MGLSLNLGLQLHYLECLFPGILDAGATIMPWAQYWAWRLCGVAACEVSSLGSHTDLWSPWTGGPSTMAIRRGWAGRLAPLGRAHEPLGVLSAEWAARTGLPASARVYPGVHDSNAALVAARAYPETRDRDLALVSTGTWFVAMRSPAKGQALPQSVREPGPGYLINVDPAGMPIPTALFMGGREVEVLSQGRSLRQDDERVWLGAGLAVDDCLTSGTAVLPTMAPGTGLFPDSAGRWLSEPGDDAAAAAAILLYAALVGDCALDRIGARDTLLVEGRFAKLSVFVRALAALRPDTRVYASDAESDVSLGAMMLLRPDIKPHTTLKSVAPLNGDLTRYRALWRQRLGPVV
jgi:sugar (pentulose or hexulose) kinase